MNNCIACTDQDGNEAEGYCEFCPDGDYPPRDRIEDALTVAEGLRDLLSDTDIRDAFPRTDPFAMFAPVRMALSPRVPAVVECQIDYILGLVKAELQNAAERFPPFASPHEGKAIIEEELDELWECVRKNTGRSSEAMAEAKQIAAMAVRYMLDLGPVAP